MLFFKFSSEFNIMFMVLGIQMVVIDEYMYMKDISFSCDMPEIAI